MLQNETEMTNENTSAMDGVQQDAVATVAAAKPAAKRRGMTIKQSRFFCSHCGISVTRTVLAADQDHNRDIAHFCKMRCATENRMAGLDRLTYKNKVLVQSAYDNLRDTPIVIASNLNLSAAAVRGFLHGTHPPTNGAYASRSGPAPAVTKDGQPRKRGGRKPRAVVSGDTMIG